MTVKKLIDELQKLAPDKSIGIYCTFDGGFGITGGENIEIIDKLTGVELFNDSD